MNHKRGIISTIVLIIIALIILGYFNIDFKSLVQSPIVKDNLAYAWQLLVEGIKTGWQYLLDAIRQIPTSIQ